MTVTCFLSLAAIHNWHLTLLGASLLDCKSTNFSMDSHYKLFKIDVDFLDDKTSFKRLIGRLLYYTHTGPKITYSIHHLRQFLDSTWVLQIQAAIRILKYTKLAPGQGVFFSSSSVIHLKVFTDLDWNICLIIKIYNFSYCVFLRESFFS